MIQHRDQGDKSPQVERCPRKKGVQAGITCTPRVATGCDKLKVSCWFDWRNPELFERLETHKRGLQETENLLRAPFDLVKSETSFNFNLHRTGTTKFSYILSTGDIIMLLSPRPVDSTLHNCQIEIGSISSQTDAQGIYQEIISVLRLLNCRLHKELVQEIHLAVDLINVPVKKTKFRLENNWIARANKFSYFSSRRRMTGMSLGAGNVMFRAYDKIAEMKEKHESSKQDFFAKKWQVDLAETDVTRCEFQIRRPVLKEFDVPTDTVQDIFVNLQAIWRYLTLEWCRFCTEPVDRENKHQDRAITSSLWELVQSAVFSPIMRTATRIRQSLIKNIDALRDQFRGIAMSLAASEGLLTDNVDYIVSRIQVILTDDLRRLLRRDKSKFIRTLNMRFNECYATVL